MADADSTPPAIIKLSDAPILFFVSFHRAFLAELENLRNLTETATTRDSQLVNHLLTRFNFLQLVYKYHCAAEDEVIFLALDKHVKNVACSYSLEHRSIDEFFESVLSNLQVLVDCGDDAFKEFKELLFSIGTFQVAIRAHMMKEEQQVFPMMVKKFSTKEQASLVWQFLCSVPIALLEDFFPWMTSFLSTDEQSDIVLCIKEVVPKEKLLQEVVLSWLSYMSYNHEGPFKHELFHEKCKDDNSAQGNYGMFDPVACLHLWHGAIKQDLNRILMELYQIQSSDDPCLSSVIAQLKFLVDVVTFYSNTLDRHFYPTLDESSGIYQSASYKRLLDRSRLQSLQQLIYFNDKKETPICEFVEKLCRELDPFLKEISKSFIFLETEIFPLIGQNCTRNIEQPLLYMSFRMMPLGLLKFVITWFSTQLSEEEIISITHCIKQGGSLVNKALESLLMVWVRFGCSGKSSIRKFRGDLLEIFKSRCSFLIEQNKEDKISSSLHLDEPPCKRSNEDEPNLASASRNSELDPLTHALISTEQCDILYSSGISMHLLSPGTLKALCSFPEFDSESGAVNSILDLESRPLDHIFFYHRALKKDLQYLVHASAKLSEKSGSLKDFQRRFHLLWYLYQLHSESEDTIAFPALETKGRKVENVSCSYSIDHKIEADYFTRVALILDEMSLLDPGLHKYGNLCVKLHDMCISMDKVICDHILREETEVWLLFRECFSVDEQEKIIGHMLGRIRAEILQQMIPWLMAALTMPEQQAIISLWRKATKNTKFDEWLGEWWEGVGECNQHNSVQESNSPLSLTTDQLDAVSKSFSKQYLRDQAAPSGKDQSLPPKISTDVHVGLGHLNVDNKRKPAEEGEDCYKCIECNKMLTGDEKRSEKGEDAPVQANQLNELYVEEQPLAMNQEELETVIRKISRDSSLDAKKKSSMIQNLLTSRWVATQQKLHSDAFVSNDVNEISGQCPSFQDPLNLTFGCKHYKRNCKLLASCCNKLFTCIRCHDEDSDHSIDRRAITKMMCMKCLVIQPIGPMCSSNSCSSFSMGKYYCSICKLFDDERKIYHCPYCNLCRVGMGLGIDYFHCMNCNACMSWTLSVHICREKCFEDNCPICHEYIFTSSSPVKALPCGHLMHSTCFQDYTCTQYTCPICSKSLGNMQVYFAMLDAMLAEENMPDEYAGLTQVVLCNDCEKRGTTPYHWLYHKCPHCGSYNTRLL